jgi:hypothetical protein
MLFAIVSGEKIEAKPRTTGVCPLCEMAVFSKCGEINVWHWAHNKDESCDSWYEPETEWHKNWKLAFGKDNCEIIISKDGVKHIADILTKSDVVIELQNSPIQKSVINKRENFYGERMLWVINGKEFKKNFTYSAFQPKGYFINDGYYLDRHGILETGESIPKSKNELAFSWDWPRKSWSGVQRYVFIDFGDENLFWVKEGMGTKIGRGQQISKEKFMKKYGGNLELLNRLVNKSKI